MKRLLILPLLVGLVGCAKPHPAQPPAPPRIEKVVEKKTYPKQTPKLGDMAIAGCTVTSETGNKADCICRKASTKIDAKDASQQSLVCK